MNPTSFRPLTAADFLGPMQKVALVRLFQARKHAAAGRTGNFRLVLSGPPGGAKSALCRLLAQTLCGVPDDGTAEVRNAQLLGILHYTNGQDVSIELVRDWAGRSAYIPVGLHGQVARRVFWVEECDAASPAALNAWRTFSDTLRSGTDLLLTTNRPLAELQKQFSSRCQADEITPPAAAEVAAFLTDRWQIPGAIAHRIAATVNGDVRNALCEAENWLDEQAALAVAA